MLIPDTKLTHIRVTTEGRSARKHDTRECINGVHLIGFALSC